MGLSIGLVGLPNAGKSTLFNALLGRQVAQVADYPFCTIKPNTGVVQVPDWRLEKIAEIVQPQKKVPAVVRFVDVAGLVKNAHQGAGLGNQFLAHLRECNALCFVLRDFEAGVPRGENINPLVDFETLKTELLLKDLETLQSMLKKHKTKPEQQAIKHLMTLIQQGKMLADVKLSSIEANLAANVALLTAKPYFVVINIQEGVSLKEKEKMYQALNPVFVVAKLEAELSDLASEEQEMYLAQLGFKESGVSLVIKRAYRVLNLITFYTIKGGYQTQAWPLPKGASVIQAAARVHSDFAQKFVAALVINFNEFIQTKGWQEAREKGLIQTKGRDYQVEDGDIIEFKIQAR